MEGVTCHLSKLTEEAVKDIRASWPGETKASISRRYGVTASNIADIIKRKTWKHV
jgi:catabolite regulation protein CreA